MGETGKESYNSEMNWRVVSRWLPKAAGKGDLEWMRRELPSLLWHLEEREKREIIEKEWIQLPLWSQSELDQI